jgi:hypothetical protein
MKYSTVGARRGSYHLRRRTVQPLSVAGEWGWLSGSRPLGGCPWVSGGPRRIIYTTDRLHEYTIQYNTSAFLGGCVDFSKFPRYAERAHQTTPWEAAGHHLIFCMRPNFGLAYETKMTHSDNTANNQKDCRRIYKKSTQPATQVFGLQWWKGVRGRWWCAGLACQSMKPPVVLRCPPGLPLSLSVQSLVGGPVHSSAH